jgi:FtsZ-binding cell division protein ZapB
MLDILKALAHGVGGMTYGDPDDADAVKAADVVRWAAAEIDRLREERRSISTLHQKVENLEAENKRLREERDTLLESQLWGVNCKPLPPGPEGDG